MKPPALVHRLNRTAAWQPACLIMFRVCMSWDTYRGVFLFGACQIDWTQPSVFPESQNAKWHNSKLNTILTDFFIPFAESPACPWRCSSERLWACSATHTWWRTGGRGGFGQNCQFGQNQRASGQYSLLKGQVLKKKPTEREPPCSGYVNLHLTLSSETNKHIWYN